MRVLIQRVTQASVTIDQKVHSKIGPGLLIFVGVHPEDTLDQAKWLADKCAHLRIFSDAEDKMNLSVQDIEGEILVVSQFTLYGNCQVGRRPAFTEAAKGELANDLYETFVKYLRRYLPEVKTGVFAADMKVELMNDGPVTFFLEK